MMGEQVADGATPEQRWRHLRDLGSKTPVDLSSNELIRDKPDWFDESKFKLARDVIQKYFIGVSFSSFTGLLLILQLPDGLEPLLVTGNSKDVPALFKRYLSTFLHVRSWYDDDVFDPSTKGYRSIRQVRLMHRRVQQLMNDKFKVRNVRDQEHIWMSQYDVALTQFAFIGLAMIWPKKCGMVLSSKEELELINYYWRVLGWLMGMKNEFNACQFDNYEDIREFNRLILENEYKAKFSQHNCPTGLKMTKSICLAMQYYSPLITFNMLANWWRGCFNFNGYEPKPMPLRERFMLSWTNLTFNRLFEYESLMRGLTKIQRWRFERRLKNKDKIYESLQKKYKDHEKYLSDRMDYFGTVQRPNGGDLRKGPLERATEQQVPARGPSGCPFGYEALLPTLEVAVDKRESVLGTD